MRFSHIAFPLFAAALLAGCNGKDVTRVAFPKTEGAYFQAYGNAKHPVAELALVDSHGNSRTFKGTFTGEVNLSKPLQNINVKFECGEINFIDPNHASANPTGNATQTLVSVPSESSRECNGQPLPDRWTVIKA